MIPAGGISRPSGAIDDSIEESSSFDLSESLSSWGVRAALLIGAVTLVRLLIISTTELANGEAYYDMWARFPSLSYYDHPPLVAWMAWLTTRFSKAEFWIRIGSVFCSGMFGALVYRLGERLFSPRAGFFALAIVTILPALIVTSYALNPESPLAPLWLLALLQLEMMRRRDEAWRPLVLGFIIGVGFLAKYSAVLLVFVTLIFVVTSPSMRRWLKRPTFYLGGFVALIAALPVIVWNAQHGWPTIQLHFVERTSSMNVLTLAHNAFRIFVGQLGPFHPLVMPALLLSLIVALRRSKRDDRYRFLAIASWPVLLFLFVMMIRVKDPESHWTMVGYIPLAVAAGGLLDEVKNPSPLLATSLRWYMRIAAGSSMIAIVFIYALSQFPAVRKAFPGNTYDAKKDVFNEMTGWNEVRTALSNDATTLGPDTVVASCQYALCAHLLTSLDDKPRVYCPSVSRTEFDFLDRRDPPADAPVLWVVDDHYQDDPARVFPDRSCTPMSPVRIEHDGVLMRTYQVTACAPTDRHVLAGP